MGKQVCIPKAKLIQMFWGKHAEGLVLDIIKKFSGEFTLEEIAKQLETGAGEVAEYQKGRIEAFSGKNANNEIANAITLADFYLPNLPCEVCFQMKNSFTGDVPGSSEELIENMETYTEIDCLIKGAGKEFKFQLKQYPEKYKEWSAEKVIKYLEEAVLPESKYNNKGNRDLSIVITIKPELHSNFKETEDFKKIHEYLRSKEIKLAEIVFLYNRNNDSMVWFQVFPRRGYNSIPFPKLSYNQAKKPLASRGS